MIGGYARHVDTAARNHIGHTRKRTNSPMMCRRALGPVFGGQRSRGIAVCTRLWGRIGLLRNTEYRGVKHDSRD